MPRIIPALSQRRRSSWTVRPSRFRTVAGLPCSIPTAISAASNAERPGFHACTSAQGKNVWVEQTPWRAGMVIVRLVKHGEQIICIRGTMGVAATFNGGQLVGVVPLSMFHVNASTFTKQHPEASSSSSHTGVCGCSSAVGSLLYRMLQEDANNVETLVYEPVGFVFAVSQLPGHDLKPVNVALVRFFEPVVVPVGIHEGDVIDQCALDIHSARPRGSLVTQWGHRVTLENRAVPSTHIWSLSLDARQQAEFPSDKRFVSPEGDKCTLLYAESRDDSGITHRCVTLTMLAGHEGMVGRTGLTVADLFDPREGDATHRCVYRRLTSQDHHQGHALWVFQPIGVVLAADDKSHFLAFSVIEPIRLPVGKRHDGTFQGFDRFIDAADG